MTVLVHISNKSIVQNGAVVKTSKWNVGKTLKVKFLNGNTSVHNKVMTEAKKWCLYGNINFTKVASGPAEIRISFNNDGHWSFIGTASNEYSKNYNNGEIERGTHGSSMNLQINEYSSDTEIRRVVLHEFGHALGLIHEHLSPSVNICWNKPVVYGYYMQTQNWSKDDVDRNLFNRYSVSQTQYSKYDRNSIMHYPVPQNHTSCDFQVGWNTDFSELDKIFISDTYPSKGLNKIIKDGKWVIGDYDNDGKDDLAKIHYSSKGFISSIYKSSSIGFNKIMTSSLIGSGGNYSLLQGDFNNDGFSDICATHLSTKYGFLSKTSLNEKNGSFTYLTHQFINKGTGGEYKKIVADFNGDNLDDIGFIHFSSNYNYLAKIALGNGDGTFKELIETTVDKGFGGKYDHIYGDFNGDGFDDIGLVHFSSNYGYLVKIAYSKGDGTFEKLEHHKISNGFGGEYKHIFGDFNGDGLTDVAITHLSSNYGYLVKISFKNNNGFSSLEHNKVSNGFGGVYKNIVGDFNGDGKSDVGLIHQSSSYGFLIKIAIRNTSGFNGLKNYSIE